jgi:hypothetical protein
MTAIGALLLSMTYAFFCFITRNGRSEQKSWEVVALFVMSTTGYALFSVGVFIWLWRVMP